MITKKILPFVTVKNSSNFFTFCSGFLGGLMIAIINTNLVNAITVNNSNSSNNLNIWRSFILGMVQGLTEFIPISSTAHLKVIPIAFGWGDPGVAFTAIIQLGSIVAVLWYFRQDLIQLTTGAFTAITTKDYQSQDFKIVVGIIIGTIPILILGLGIKLFIPDFDNSPLRSLTTIAIASIFMSILLAIAEITSNHQRNFEKLTIQDGILMGIAQSLAIIPGVSRSGSTITSGLFLNLERATAARFSFLLGIPAITIAGLVELKDLVETGITSDYILPVIVGLISATIFSYLAIAWLINFLKKRNTWIFVWYRLIFGLLILILSPHLNSLK